MRSSGTEDVGKTAPRPPHVPAVRVGNRLGQSPPEEPVVEPVLHLPATAINRGALLNFYATAARGVVVVAHGGAIVFYDADHAPPRRDHGQCNPSSAT